MSNPVQNMRPLTALVVDAQPARAYGTKLVLEGKSKQWTPTTPVKVVGQAGTGDEALGLASSLSPDVAVVDPAIGETAGDGCSSVWLVLALRLAGVERVVLFGGQEDLRGGATLDEVRSASGADAAIEAGRSSADMANAVVGTKTDPPS